MITAEQSQLSKVEVDYITMPGWKSKIAGVTSYNDLPINAKNYIVKIQELTGIPSELLLSSSLYLRRYNFVCISLWASHSQKRKFVIEGYFSKIMSV